MIRTVLISIDGNEADGLINEESIFSFGEYNGFVFIEVPGGSLKAKISIKDLLHQVQTKFFPVEITRHSEETGVEYIAASKIVAIISNGNQATIRIGNTQYGVYATEPFEELVKRFIQWQLTFS